MKCPICNSCSVAIDMHSDGYADNLLECAFCEAMWTYSFGKTTLINKQVA